MDVAGAAAGLLLLSPLLLAVALAIIWKMGTPVVFAQTRAGRGGKPFVMYKFRSMNDARDGHGVLLPDGARLTELGKLLRRTSVDELPQLWNVLKGDMSLVGPRPLLMDYVPLYSERQKRRLDVKPGITGWAQTHGRNAITWEEKFDLDLWYVEHWSVWLDVRILMATVAQVAGRSGQGDNISAPGEATMPRFTGTR
ncbi:MAG: sugar transferase [Synergistaceae bacterium]|nr:sugar transferase [Synergistaceae bacterium]